METSPHDWGTTSVIYCTIAILHSAEFDLFCMLFLWRFHKILWRAAYYTMTLRQLGECTLLSLKTTYSGTSSWVASSSACSQIVEDYTNRMYTHNRLQLFLCLHSMANVSRLCCLINKCKCLFLNQTHIHLLQSSKCVLGQKHQQLVRWFILVHWS